MIKKSAVDLTDLALGIIILGITVIVGANIMMNFIDNQLSEIDTTLIGNETVAANDASTALGTNGVISYGIVTNATGGEVIPTTNYTTTTSDPGVAGYIDFGLTSLYNATNVNVTYTVYDATDARYSLPNDAATGLAEYGNWFDIIVIVGVAGLILALIFMAFGNRGVGGTDVAY